MMNNLPAGVSPASGSAPTMTIPVRGSRADFSPLLPTRLDAAARERIEARVQAIGRDLLAKSLAAQPTVLSPDYWAEQAGEWVLADDDLKVRLFRLVDCMPMLDDPAAVDRHLREYLDVETIEKLPLMLRTALKAARSGILAPFAARAVRAAMLAQAKRFIAGTTPTEAAKAALPAGLVLDTGELYDFILDRLRSYFADRGVGAALFDAVAATKPVSLADFAERLSALQRFAELPEAAALAAANKRARNILKKVEGALPETIDASKLVEPAERALDAAIAAVAPHAERSLAALDYTGALTTLAGLREPVDEQHPDVSHGAPPTCARSRPAWTCRGAARTPGSSCGSSGRAPGS
jgi:hypothetical protein